MYSATRKSKVDVGWVEAHSLRSKSKVKSSSLRCGAIAQKSKVEPERLKLYITLQSSEIRFFAQIRPDLTNPVLCVIRVEWPHSVSIYEL